MTLADESRITLARPRLSAWMVNAGVILLLAALWPVNLLAQEYMDAYYLRVLVLVGINITLAVSLNLINGITGQFSLGHAGFMAIGAYTTGTLMHYWRPGGAMVPVAIVSLLMAGGILASVAGLIVGIPALRLRGDYLAIATLGFGEIIYTLIINTEDIGPLDIGGASGLHGIPIVANFFWTYLTVLLCVVCVWRLAYSTKGMAFRAVREDEIAAAAMGIDTTYYKASAFVIGAFFAGVAGGLFAIYNGNLDPASFRFMRSIEIVVMVVLGGQGSITGAILAAGVLTYLPEGLRNVDENWKKIIPFRTEGILHWLWSINWSDLRMVLYALILILMMLLRPKGLLGSREIWFSRRRTGPASA